MKKQLFFLVCLLGLTQSTYAYFTHGNWRWRNDDGNETTATWLAAENTPIEITDMTKVIRLRIHGNNAFSTDLTVNNALFYSTQNNSSEYIQISDLASEKAFVFANSANSALIDGMATTKQLSGSTIVPGYVSSSSASKSAVLSASASAEFEFVIKPTNSILPGTTYYLSMNGYEGANIYLTTAATLPVKMASFSAKKTNVGTRLTWQTASELDNERFEIERSTDGKNWQVIGKVIGKNEAAAYQFEDNRPAAGENYYRLAQYDHDGTVDYSAVRVVSFALNKAEVSVYPNPVAEQLTIALPQFKGQKVSLKLSDVTGKLLHISEINVRDEKAVYMLPTGIGKGLYLVNVTAEGLNYSTKITVK